MDGRDPVQSLEAMSGAGGPEDAARTRDPLADLENRLDEIRGALNASREEAAKIDLEREKLLAEQAEFERLRAEADRARQEAERLRSQVSEDRGRIEHAKQEIERERSRLEEQRSSAAAAAEEAENRLRAAEEARRAAEELASRAQGEQGEIESLRRQVQEDRSAIDSARAELEEQQRRLDESRSAIEREWVDASSAARRDVEALHEQLRNEQSQVEAARARLEEERRQVEVARESVDREREAATRASTELSAEERSALEAARSEVDRVRREAEETVTRARAAQQALDERERQVTSREESLRDAESRLTKRVSELDQRAKGLEAHESAATAASTSDRPGPVTPHESRRRSRLKRARRMVASQTRKLKQAAELLERRQAEADKILSKRTELGELQAKLDEREQKLQKSKAATGASWCALALAITLAVLAGMSWWASGIVHPPRHMATIVLNADGGRRALTEQNLDDWHEYVTTRFADPAYLDRAADRLGKRGISSVSEPSLLSAFLREHVEVDRPSPAAVRLEVVSEGEARTVRKAEAIAAELVSTANESRAQRSDAAATQLADEPTVVPLPGSTARAMLGAAIWAGAALLVTIAWIGLWRIALGRGEAAAREAIARAAVRDLAAQQSGH